MPMPMTMTMAMTVADASTDGTHADENATHADAIYVAATSAMTGYWCCCCC